MRLLPAVFFLLTLMGVGSIRAQESSESVSAPSETTSGAGGTDLSPETPPELPPELLGTDTGTPSGGEAAGSTSLRSVPDYVYDPTGRRDPFMIHKSFRKREIIAAPGNKSPGPKMEIVDPLLRLDIGRIEIVGIIWEVANPRALIAETGDPEHKVYIVNKHTKVGRNNGYVAAIREGEIVIIETFEEEGIVTQQPKVIKLLTGK